MFGVSFTISGRPVHTFFTRLTRSSSTGASHPNSIPPFSRFGQETFSSSAANSLCGSNFRAHSAYSSTSEPMMLAMTGTVSVRSRGSSSARYASTPGFWMPIALRRPARVSAMRGSGFPARGCRLMLFNTAAPIHGRLGTTCS